MCKEKKCCFCVNVNAGCTWIGATTFVFSTIMTVTSAVFLEMGTPVAHSNDGLGLFMEKYFSKASEQIIEWTVLSLGVTMMIASLMLIYGAQKNKPGFLLCYFVFGIFFTICCNLSAILFLIDQLWEIAFVVGIVTIIFIRFLVEVHMTYDSMQREFDNFEINDYDDTRALV